MLVQKTTASWPHPSMPNAAPSITRDARANRSRGLEIQQDALDDLSNVGSNRPAFVLSSLGWRYG